MMRHKSPTPEQLSGFLSVKAIAALYFPCYLTSRSQMKALQKKLNENSTWFTPQQVDLLFDEWGNPDYNIRKNRTDR